MEAPELDHPRFTVDYLAILRGIWRRHKLLVVVVFLVIAGPGLLVVYYTNTPLYLSRAMIAIEPAGLSQLPFLREPPRQETIAAHMVLLKSRSLTEAVLEAVPRDTYNELLVKRQYVDYWVLAKNTIQGWLGKSPTVLSPREQALSELRLGRMEFSPLKEAANVFVISATATQPRVATDLVNTYIQVLLNRARSVDRAEAQRAREFLETQYQQVKDSLARTEESVSKLQQQKGRMKSGAHTDMELVRLAQLESNLADAQANRQVLSTRIEGLRRALDQVRSREANVKADDPAKEEQQSDQAAATSLAAENQRRTNAFKTAQEQLARMETKLASLRERYTEAHPQVQITREEISRQQARVTQLARDLPVEPPPTKSAGKAPGVPATPSDRLELQSQLTSLERESDTLAGKEEALKLQVARLRGNLQNLSQDDVAFGNLRRSVEANRNLLAVLSDRLMAARIREQGDSSVIRVIDPPSLPFETTAPKTQRLLLMVLALAGSVAVGLAAGIEFLRQPLETETDVQKATGLRVLGCIGTMGTPGPSKTGRRDSKPILLPVSPTGASAAQTRSIHAELYRAIRSRIEAERLKSPFRSILVTSPSPHEGKSTTVLNLAHVFQESGRRVLLVDADLRRPSLASPLALTNKPGVVDYLHGVATLEQVCRRLPSGVTVIPGQVSPGDSVSLLASARFKELLHAAGTQFDLVLVDSAPILAVPDNILLANIIDRVILVVKATKTSGRELRKAVVALEETGGRILGVVLNAANPLDVPYYHPRYRKYYTPSAVKDSQGASRRPVLTPAVEAKKGAGPPVMQADQRRKQG